MDFSQRLKDLRKEKGINQQTLADFLCVDKSSVSKWEHGANYPNQNIIEMLCDYFGVSVDYLLGRTDESAHTHAHVKGLYPLDAYVKIPALGIIRGGQPICTEQGEYDEVFADAKFGDGNHFMLKVQGDSMSPTIPNGAWAIVSTIRHQKMRKPYCLVGFLLFYGLFILRRFAWVLLLNYYQISKKNKRKTAHKIVSGYVLGFRALFYWSIDLFCDVQFD